MRVLSEEQTAALITHEIAYEAVREALRTAASGSQVSFPPARAHGADPLNTFSIKPGSSAQYAGVKIGSFWPGNSDLGLPRHGTTILLLDQETGRAAAVVEASAVNAFRTAAADAVAADLLARPDARTLTVFGSGHQAFHECLALARIRNIDRILVVARDEARGADFCSRLVRLGHPAELADAKDACDNADIITTATTATAALFDADWVRPGTHVASMGSDSPGKQELPTELFPRARLFCDLPTQSVVIGEFQHVAALIEAGTLQLTAIGAAIDGSAPGRTDEKEITVFDSSGIALQDLAVAAALLSLAD